MSDKAALVSVLATEINPNVLLVNSGKSKADFLVLLEVVPEKLLLKYINEQKKDVLITVSRIREEADRIRGNVPRSFNGFYQVKIWAIDKPGVDGNDLRDLAFEEIKRVFAENPAQRVFSETEDDHKVGALNVFCSVFTVIKITET